MTPAVVALKRAGIAFSLHKYVHDKSSAAYGEEAAHKLGLDPAQVFKTLLVALDGGELAVAIVPVANQLNLKRCAAAFGAKTACMAKPAAAERATGYVVGGISPLGQKRRLRSVIDASAEGLSTLFVSAGRRGLKIELAPQDLSALLQAGFAAIAG